MSATTTQIREFILHRLNNVGGYSETNFSLLPGWSDAVKQDGAAAATKHYAALSAPLEEEGLASSRYHLYCPSCGESFGPAGYAGFDAWRAQGAWDSCNECGAEHTSDQWDVEETPHLSIRYSWVQKQHELKLQQAAAGAQARIDALWEPLGVFDGYHVMLGEAHPNARDLRIAVVRTKPGVWEWVFGPFGAFASGESSSLEQAKADSIGAALAVIDGWTRLLRGGAQ